MKATVRCVHNTAAVVLSAGKSRGSSWLQCSYKIYSTLFPRQLDRERTTAALVLCWPTPPLGMCLAKEQQGVANAIRTVLDGFDRLGGEHALGTKTPAVCQGLGSRCKTGSWHLVQTACREFSGKMPGPTIGTHSLREPAQSCDTSHFMREFTAKMPGPKSGMQSCASLRRRNAYGHVTRATLRANFQQNAACKTHAADFERAMDISQEPF